jgi:integrase
MARGTPISGARALTSSSRPPSPPTLILSVEGLSGESFNWDASRVGLEDTVPERERWWAEASERYAERRRLAGEWSRAGAAGAARCLKAWPGRFEAAGLPRPNHTRDVTAEMVLTWKERPMGFTRWDSRPKPVRSTTAFQAIWHLRNFLREYRNPIAEKEGLWRGKPGDAVNRRWFDCETIDRMYAGATERQRLVLALAAWAGLRRREISSLRVGDVTLTIDNPRMVVTRKGGRRQELPISKAVLNVLRPWIVGRAPEDTVYPQGYFAVQRDVEAIGRIIRRPVSCHDLRRSFGESCTGAVWTSTRSACCTTTPPPR